METWLIQIGNLYLTRDGTADGDLCLLDFPNAPAIIQASAGNSSVDANGSPFRETPLHPIFGREVEITVRFCPVSLFESLKTLLDAAAAANDIFDFSVSGVPGEFTGAAAVWDNPVYLGFGDFSSDIVENVVIRLLTADPG